MLWNAWNTVVEIRARSWFCMRCVPLPRQLHIFVNGDDDVRVWIWVEFKLEMSEVVPLSVVLSSFEVYTRGTMSNFWFAYRAACCIAALMMIVMLWWCCESESQPKCQIQHPKSLRRLIWCGFTEWHYHVDPMRMPVRVRCDTTCSNFVLMWATAGFLMLIELWGKKTYSVRQWETLRYLDCFGVIQATAKHKLIWGSQRCTQIMHIVHENILCMLFVFGDLYPNRCPIQTFPNQGLNLLHELVCPNQLE